MLSAKVAGHADGWTRTSDNCGGYSGYSEDTAADNVSSPRPRSRRGYSEDTQIRAEITAARRAFSPSFCVTQRDALCRPDSPLSTRLAGLETPSHRVLAASEGNGLVLQPQLETLESALVVEPAGAGLVPASPV